MGGIIIIISTVISALLWGNPLNLFLLLSTGTLIFMGSIGFIDDYKKIKNKNGLNVKAKFSLQILWTIIFLLILWIFPETQGKVKEINDSI